MHKIPRTVSTLALVVGLGACKAKTEETPSDDLRPPIVHAQTTRAPMAPAPTPAPLSDGQIAAIAGAANKSELAAAKSAISKTTNPDVRRFADMMITDHTKVDGEATALFAKLDVQPTPGDISAKIDRDATAAAMKLDAATGADFDKAYVDGQVAAHQQVLDLLETQLIPSAHAPELAALLTSVRTSVQAHLTMAKALQSQLRASK